jgi:hypothetical protein
LEVSKCLRKRKMIPRIQKVKARTRRNGEAKSDQLPFVLSSVILEKGRKTQRE